jgi:hypothetical protein
MLEIPSEYKESEESVLHFPVCDAILSGYF